MNNNKLCENKKWELVNFCEFDKYAEKSYCAIHNVDSSKNLGDITKVDEENLSPFNMICGGSPCQDFSVAGKQKGSIWTCKDCSHEYNPLTVHWSERDKCPHCGSTNLEKTRSSLLVEYLRVIRSNKPNFGIYENVKNIVGKQFKETTFKLFTDELEEYGYNVYWKVLNAKHYGIPQNRERVYLIFIKKELDNGEFKFPVPFDNGTRLKDILENKVDEKYYISEEKVKKFIKNIHTYESNTSNEQHFIGNINRPDLGTGYAGGVSNVNEALTAYDSGDSLSYMNSLVDQQVSGKKLEQNARKTAVEQANANVATANKQKKEADKKFAKLQKKYKNSKKLTAAQKKKIAAGKEIDTTGITDAKQLKILTAYNNALADSKKKKENVTIATNALAEANENLMTAEVESAQATVEAVSTKFDNAKTYYEALLSYQEQLSKYQEKNIDLAKAHGDYEKSSDYDTKISNTQAEMAIKQNELDELTKQLDDGVEAGTIVENSQEWLDMQTKIKEAQNAVADYDTQIEELKQSQIGVYYEEQFKRAAEKVDRFRDKLDGLKSLISDDMKIDKNTGLLTESGALSITLDVDDINASTENLKTYIKERQQIINDYNAGKFGEDEYNQKLKDVDANIKSTTANIYSSRNSILELVKSQSQAELDVLNKVIDKRKEALSAKKNYYDYDKTLKNKTKDIEVLERQIAALEGSTSAEDKARKAKLQEQLDSAKEDLNDTITDHAYSMQTDALDKLSADMSEDLDKWINTISSNMEEMTTAINDAVKNAGLSTAGTINAISSILRHYRLSDSEISQSGLTNITGYASGTNYVNKSGIYRVNEKGMESVFSKQYGTLTFLNQGDKVFDANFTKQLLDNSTIATQKNMPDYAGMAKAIEKNIQNIQNLSGNTYVNNFYIDGAQDTESILREIDKHLDKKIQAHDKKQVRDFKSLR